MNDIYDVTSDAEKIDEKNPQEDHCWNGLTVPDKIQNLKFSGTLELLSTKTTSKKLLFENCIFYDINIKIKNAADIQKVKFINCEIHTLTAYNSKPVLCFEGCQIYSILIDRCNISSIRIEETKLNSIIFINDASISKLNVSNDSEVEIIDDKDAVINNVIIHRSSIKFIHINKSIGQLELSEGASLEKFFIDDKDELKKFLINLKKRRVKLRKGTLSQRVIELRHQHRIILAAYNYYSEMNRFYEMDICLVMLRKVNCILDYYDTKSIFRKLICIIKYVALGSMLGWGIQISNSIITSTVFILIFAAIYFDKLHSTMGINQKCIELCFETSVIRYFNLDPVDSFQILEHFDPLEQIIGVIMMTILTGVIARKIIR